MNLLKNKTDRRSFFSMAAKSSLGAIILTSFPVKLLASSGKYTKLKKVEIHKQAVKRN
jgi:hypothetical protein